MCWFLAGQDLCRIKVDATGLIRILLLEIWKIYRPDGKTVKRIVEPEEEESDEGSDD
jgi:hypothetical protein